MLFCYCLCIALTSIGHKQQRQFPRLNIIFNQSVQQSNILLSIRKIYVFINMFVKQYRIVSAELEKCIKSENGQHSEVLEDILHVFLCGLQFLLLKGKITQRSDKAFVKNRTQIHHVVCKRTSDYTYSSNLGLKSTLLYAIKNILQMTRPRYKLLAF